MEYDLKVLENLCKFYQSKVIGLNPTRVSNIIYTAKKEIKLKYKEFKTDGYYVNIIHQSQTNQYGYVIKHRQYVGLSLKKLSDGGEVILSIEKSDSEKGEITENNIVLNGSKPIRYKNNQIELNVNKYLTKDKFFENIIMSDITLEYKYFEMAMKMKEALQHLEKKIMFEYNNVDNEILKRTLVNAN